MRDGATALFAAMFLFAAAQPKREKIMTYIQKFFDIINIHNVLADSARQDRGFSRLPAGN